MNNRYVTSNGIRYLVVGQMSTDAGAMQMAETYSHQTGKCAGYMKDPDQENNYLVIALRGSMQKTIKVKCKLCKCKFEVTKEQAISLIRKNGGYIPCTQCGSHATIWKVPNKVITYV